MTEKWTRRAVLRRGVVAGAVVPAAAMLAGSRALADAAPLDPSDPTAKALGYVSASPNPAQTCAGCAQFQGKSGDASGGCTLFPGKTVAAAAWCKAWAKKAGT
jgi:hypothetical protein